MAERHIQWNENQKALQSALVRGKDQALAVRLFLNQHALVHAAQVSGAATPTFEDEIWQNLQDAAARIVPSGFSHSVAWLAWHSARCEDITMNLLVAGSPQVLDDWFDQICVPFRDTGNTMDLAAGELFNTSIEINALRSYRAAVGSRTREIVQSLSESAFRQPVDPTRAAQLIPQGIVMEEARGLVDYWGSRTFAGLLLMPATRHHIVHWNEAAKLKKKLKIKA